MKKLMIMLFMITTLQIAYSQSVCDNLDMRIRASTVKEDDVFGKVFGDIYFAYDCTLELKKSGNKTLAKNVVAHLDDILGTIINQISKTDNAVTTVALLSSYIQMVFRLQDIKADLMTIINKPAKKSK